MSTSSVPQAREDPVTPVQLQLSLFVSGASPTSIRAVQRLHALCEEHCAEGYDLKIIDIYQQPEAAVAARVLAVPTLVKELPLPVRRLVGDFSDEPRVLAALGLAASMDE